MKDIMKFLMGESLTIEYKEDGKGFSDKDLVDSVVAMSNSLGGKILIGVTDDCKIVGSKRLGIYWINEHTIVSIISENTTPSVMVKVEILSENEKKIIVIDVLPSQTVVGSKAGRFLNRKLDYKGEPTNLPMRPEEIARSVYVASSTDFSSSILRESSLDEIDLELVDKVKAELLKEAERRGKEKDISFFSMDSTHLLSALALIDKNSLIPNVACMLLFGKKECLESRFPNSFVQFQEISDTGEMLQNERYSDPLVQLIPTLLGIGNFQKNSDEFTFKGQSYVIPEYSQKALREAIANALVHRDYTLPNPVQIKLSSSDVCIISPGGFPLGVTVDDILSGPPTPRNRRLTEALYRLLFVESSGRGIDFIFYEQARYGRPTPDYSSSMSNRVVLRLVGGKAHLDFCKMIIEYSEKLTIEEMLLVNGMFNQRDITIKEASRLIQESESRSKSVLANLMKKNLIESINIGVESYFLKSSISPFAKKVTKPLRLTMQDKEKYSNAIINTLKRKGEIQVSKIADSVGLSISQTYRLLRSLEEGKKIESLPSKKWKIVEL
jgi:ATP-dependent DNA helicase RecG